MYKLFLLTCLLGFVSCESGKFKKSQSDSLVENIERERMVDSIMRSGLQNAMFKDTLNLDSAPVKITSARPKEKEYSNYKDISLSYKNVSGKTISAIRFRWYGTNAFNEPADMGGLEDRFGGGFTDETLRSGKTGYGTWNILSRDLKKVVKAWPTEVAFEDGTSWKP